MSDTGLGPWDPNQPHGDLKQDPTKGPASAGTPGGIGQAPTPPGTPKVVISPSELAMKVYQSQQGKPLQINIPWLLAEPDSPSRTQLLAIADALNVIFGA